MKATIFSLFFFSLIIIYCNGYATSQNLIQNICRTASKEDPNMPYGFCTTSLQAAPASGCASLRGLGMISIRLARYNLTDTRCHIKQLLMDKRLDVHVRACLNDCLELYSDAIPSIKEGMRYYKEKSFSEANVQVSAVMDAATTCEDGFNEWPGVVSPLTKRNDATFKLSAIVLYIMHVLEKGSN